MKALAAYQQTLVWTGQRIAGVRAEDLRQPTPCSEWDLRAVVAHVVAGLWYFHALAAHEPVEQMVRALTDLVGDDAFASYEHAARGGLEAWSRPGALEQRYRLPLGERPGRDALAIHQTDLLLHGWDVAEATHQDSTMEEPLAEFSLATARSFIEPAMRGPGRAYAEARRDAPGATAHERLLAFVGRSDDWR